MFDTPLSENTSHYRMTPFGRIVPPEYRTSVEDLLAWAGLDWRVRVEPLSTNDRETGLCAIVREDNGAVLSKKSVSHRYTPFQNIEAFGLLREQFRKGELIPEVVCGDDSGMGRIWLLCHSKVKMDIGSKDPVHMYFIISNSHTHNTFSALPLSMRIYCTNFLYAALDRADSFTLRHVGDWESKRHQLSAGLAGLHNVFQAQAVRMNTYAKEVVPTYRVADKLAGYVFQPDDADALDGYSLPQAMKRDALRNLVQDPHHEAMGEHGPLGLEGTAWAALNAVTFYTTHLSKHRSHFDERVQPMERKRDLAAKRFNEMVYGKNRVLVSRAIRFLDAFVQNGTCLTPPPPIKKQNLFAKMEDEG